jgi:CBS domain-containing protein
VVTDYEADILGTTLVGQVMTKQVETVPLSAKVGEARALLTAHEHAVAPVVVDGGRCVGVLARRDLLDPTLDNRAPISEVATHDVVTASPSDSLLVALRRMLAADITHLPVVEEERLVGICTRTDILEARQRQFDEELRQPGLLQALKRLRFQRVRQSWRRRKQV